MTDLARRGLLDDTLVIWGGEFGRTPIAQSGDGRDHNPYGYMMWMAGAGIRSGMVHGETDDYSYNIVRDPIHIHDLNATVLHLLGINHLRMTVKFQGIDARLTGISGEVVKAILA